MPTVLIPGAPPERPRATRQVCDETTGRWRAARPRERRSPADRYRAQAYARRLDGTRIKSDIVARTAELAERRAVERLQAVLDAERGRKAKSPQLRVVVQEWINDPSRPGRTAASTAKLYERMAARWLIDPRGTSLAALKVDQIHPHDVTLWLASIAREAGLPSARTARTVLSAVYGYAISQRLVNSSPTREATLAGAKGRPRRAGRPGPSPELDPKRAFTAGERERLISTTRAQDLQTGDDLADLLVFVGATGVRIGEALALHWQDVDLAGSRAWVDVGEWTAARVEGAGVQRVPHGSTKRAVRRLALSAEASAVLRTRYTNRRHEVLVFGSPLDASRYREVSAVTKRIRRVLSGLDGDDGRPMTWASSHTLRRTIVSQLHAAGMPTAAIADQTGHRDLRVLEEHYIARIPSSSAAADLLDAGPKSRPHASTQASPTS